MRYTVTFEQTESDPPERLVNTIVDQSLPFGGTITFSLTPIDQGTALMLTSRGEIRNPGGGVSEKPGEVTAVSQADCNIA